MKKTIYGLLYILLLSIWVQPAAAQENPDPHRFATEIEAFRQWDQKNTPSDGAILFIGSSSIRMWPTAEAFPQLHVMNRGFGGAHLSDVLFYLDDVLLKYRPVLIVLYAGDNDIHAGKSPDRILDDYRLFTRRVHNAMPGTPIVYLSIKPSPSRWDWWPRMKQANELVRSYSETRPDLFFVDLAAPLTGTSGAPEASLFMQDQLHLNPAGYARWTQTLAPILASILKDLKPAAPRP